MPLFYWYHTGTTQLKMVRSDHIWIGEEEYNYPMKTKLIISLLSFTFLFFFTNSASVNAKQKFGDYEGAIYVRNYDGDTITFTLPNLHL